MFFQLVGVGLNRSGDKKEEFRVFFELDFMKSIDRFFCRFGQVGEAFDRLAIHFGDDDILEVFVADGVGGGEDLGEDDDAATVGGEFVLEGVIVNQALRCVGCPFASPFLEVGAGELDENEAAKDDLKGGIGSDSMAATGATLAVRDDL